MSKVTPSSLGSHLTQTARQSRLKTEHLFYADRTSAKPIANIHGDPHVLVPFAVENGRRLGARAALAHLRALMVVAIGKSWRSPFANIAVNTTASVLVSLRV